MAGLDAERRERESQARLIAFAVGCGAETRRCGTCAHLARMASDSPDRCILIGAPFAGRERMPNDGACEKWKS